MSCPALPPGAPASSSGLCGCCPPGCAALRDGVPAAAAVGVHARHSFQVGLPGETFFKFPSRCTAGRVRLDEVEVG